MAAVLPPQHPLRTGFVQAGGSYLGLCAGAYYACAAIEFEPGSALQVTGLRELHFLHGVAKGAAFPGACVAACARVNCC
jgi:glutamine amidotransferase-like uncharacterized protein